MRSLSLLAWLFFACVVANAAGPRFVTGRPYFTGQEGVAIGWRGPQLLYSTDPGALSATVNHAAADALVAAAAGVWNVPVAGITLAQGAPLAEHVSVQNVYFDTTGLHFPADVMAANAPAVPLAILYDTDGSVTDTLLGAGASNPSGCRQNAVMETVDAFDPAGYIQHAIIVINGRCTGTAAAAQQQLRYQLMRVFGRVLGLAWSQTNENVFTGSPAPTALQAQNWPIMHPLDIICGAYTYQCLPNPFTLRIDDIAGLVAVYPIDGSSPIPAGKQLSYHGAQGLKGRMTFPTGEGMAGVNVLVRRMVYGTNVPETFFAGSGVTGAYAHLRAQSPFVPADPGPQASMGTGDTSQLGSYLVPWYPILGPYTIDDRLTSTEPVNPLYTGEYSLGPYPAGNVQPSGSPFTHTLFIVGAGLDYLPINIADAASTCSNGADGTAPQPMPVPATGWWTGLTCGSGHVAYASSAVRPGRTFTVEVTALDAQGSPTTSKLMPVLGLFAASDTPPSAPSLGATVTAFNGLTNGTTTLHAATGSASSLRFAIADQRGDGRPDYNYQARLFYADSIAPGQIANAGGTVTITGLGFRSGNAVTLNGVPATVQSWTANTLVLTAPSAQAVGATAGTPLDVTVTDRGTGATSTITAALTYGPTTHAKSMRLLAAPAGTLLAGDAASDPFTVQLVEADGKTPVAGATVTFSVPTGAASFSACAAATCTLSTDANGLASTRVTPGAPGIVTLQGTAGALSQSATFTAVQQATRLDVIATPESPLRVGIASQSTFGVQSIGSDGYHSLPFRYITFSATSGAATFAPCYASTCTILSNYFGQAWVQVIPQSVGPIAIQARDGDLTQTLTVQSLSNADSFTIAEAPPAQFYVNQSHNFYVRLLHADGTPDYGQSVTFTIPPGVATGECLSSICTIVSNGNGLAWVTLISANLGTFTVQATYGGQTLSATYTVVPHQTLLKVLSVPPDNSPTGVVAARPFQVQVVEEDGVTPAAIAGQSIIMGGANGAISMTNCGFATCEIWVGGDAIATAWIIPQQAGPLILSAIHAPLVTSVTFTAVGGSRSINVIQQPGAGGAPLNQITTLRLQVMGPDGVTPVPGDLLHFSVVSGPYAFTGGWNTFQCQSDGNGFGDAYGIATGYGPVVIQVTDGYVTRLITFTAGTPPNVMQLVSTPPSPSTTGVVAARPFIVQVFAQDGVTPAAGQRVTFTLTVGSASFVACPTAACVVITDAQGLASVQVTPLAAGVIGLLAADGLVTQPVLFTAVAPPDVLRVTSTPANGSFVSVPAPIPIAVQVLLADGTTLAAGKSVTLAVTSGSATLSACAIPCTLIADANGTVSTPVTPTAAGTITLQATEGATTISTTFTAVPRPDLLRLVSAPTGTVGTGYPAATAFTVQLLQGDGLTPQPGKTVVFTAAQGSASFSTSTALTAADGTASTLVTPLTPGAITVLATEAALTVQASFTAAALPDILHITSAPASGAFTGLPSTLPFSLQVLLADASTPASGRLITLSVTAGTASFTACAGASTCTIVADANGILTTLVTPITAGTITLQAADAGTTATVTFTTLARPDTLTLLSTPTGPQPTGIPTPVPFAVKLLQADGTPDPAKPILFTLTNAQAPNCQKPCTVPTALDGTASITVTPTAAGPVTLTATYGTLTQTTTFTAYTRPDTLTLLSTPTSGGSVGDPAATPFTVQVLAGDGTPAPGHSVTLSVQTGAATFSACAGASTCVLLADSTGKVSTLVTPTTTAPTAITATDGQAVVSATLTAIARPDILRLLTAPSGTLYVGATASTPFAVQLLAADGVTPRSGVSIAFAAVTGSARFGAANVLTDPQGIASTTLTPLSPGPLTLTATTGLLTVSATLNAIANQYALTTATPAIYLAEGATAEVVLTAHATQNGTPASAQSVAWSGNPGLQPTSALTTTSPTGDILTVATAGPLAPGAQAAATACAWSNVCTSFTAIGVPTADLTPSFLGTPTALQPVTIVISDAAGHPVAGVPVSIYQTVTAYPQPCPAQGRCPAAPVIASLVTAATSDLNGRYTFTPLTVQGLPTQTEIAVSTGTSGFVAATFIRQP